VECHEDYLKDSFLECKLLDPECGQGPALYLINSTKMNSDEQWWPDVGWRIEGFRADPALRDGFVELHEELGRMLTEAREAGDQLVPVDVRFLATMYYALLAQVQMSNQSILLEIQDLRNDLAKLYKER